MLGVGVDLDGEVVLGAKQRDDDREEAIRVTKELGVLAPQLAEGLALVLAGDTDVGLVALDGEGPGLTNAIGHPVIVPVVTDGRATPDGLLGDGLEAQECHVVLPSLDASGRGGNGTGVNCQRRRLPLADKQRQAPGAARAARGPD